MKNLCLVKVHNTVELDYNVIQQAREITYVIDKCHINQ
jgi:hypothetical protein